MIDAIQTEEANANDANAETDMGEIVTNADTIRFLKFQLRELEAQEVEKLDLATDTQMTALLDNVRAVRTDRTPKDLGLNVFYRLDGVQRAKMGVAKAEHEKLCNTPTVKAQAAELVASGHLQSFKLRMTKQGMGFKISGRVCNGWRK